VQLLSLIKLISLQDLEGDSAPCYSALALDTVTSLLYRYKILVGVDRSNNIEQKISIYFGNLQVATIFYKLSIYYSNGLKMT